MSRTLAGVVLVTISLCSTASLHAHHSALLFDVSKILTLTGTLTKVDWRNPHVAVLVDVKRDGATVESWQFETGAPSWFHSRNVARVDFEKAIGHVVTVETVRAKDGSRYGYLYRITFADGQSLELR